MDIPAVLASLIEAFEREGVRVAEPEEGRVREYFALFDREKELDDLLAEMES